MKEYITPLITVYMISIKSSVCVQGSDVPGGGPGLPKDAPNRIMWDDFDEE